MAFSPLHSFHRNKKFWMAAILMVCMVTFVFCTGMRGDLSDRILGKLRAGGPTVAVVNGHNVNEKDLYDLKTQRNFANDLLSRCADIAFKKVSKEWHEVSKKDVGEDEGDKRKYYLAQLNNMRMSLAESKSRQRYFETGTKFDDLIEFKLWQAQADHMGIRIEDDHVRYLFRMEFFNKLDEMDLINIQREVLRNYPNSNEKFVQHAIAEEFRVRMAQIAVMGMQPFSFRFRSNQATENFVPKFLDRETPDEIRAPLTPAQLWDFYKAKRAAFDVALIPVQVEAFAKKFDAPTVADKLKFFNDNRAKPFDPSSGEWGLEVPPQIKVEYVMADPQSPAYLNKAKTRHLLTTVMPPLLGWNLLGDPLLMPATTYVGCAKLESSMILQPQYERIGHSNKAEEYASSPFFAGNGTTPILAWLAKQHPQAAASLVGQAFLATIPQQGGLGLIQAEASYLSWGAHNEHELELQAGQRAEGLRRLPLYAALVLANASLQVPFSQVALLSAEGLGIPMLPVEVVREELREMRAHRQAEDWARENMLKVREELTSAGTDKDKVKRVLNKYVPLYHLTYGPPAADKEKYYNRYTIANGPFEALRKSYLKNMTMINYIEGRDSKPETLLKESDFYKIFFDSSEPFAAATLYRAMPWPPVVTPGSIRSWKLDADPRLLNTKGLDQATKESFFKHMLESDPNRQASNMDLFNSADNPILFWRTAQLDPPRPAEYSQIAKEEKQAAEELKNAEQALAKAKAGSEEFVRLQEKKTQAETTLGNLKDLEERIKEGWKFQEARRTKALPEARTDALNLVKSHNNPEVFKEEAKKFGEPIKLPAVSAMYRERGPNNVFDYFTYPLPKDQIAYPREDMVQQIVSLYELKNPIEIKDADPKKEPDPKFVELNKLNRELFDLAKAQKNPPDQYVQVLTNKPLSVFYIAVVSHPPKLDDYNNFVNTMKGSPYELREAAADQFRFQKKNFIPADTFVQRAQAEQAKQWRQQIVADLGRAFGYSISDAEFRTKFDGQGGRD